MSEAKILVIENDAIVSNHLKQMLTRQGYSVMATASSGLTAIEKADKLQPDLVLMDIGLQGEMDGIQAAEHIRTHFDIPVVFLTAYPDEDTLKRARITEPFGYVLKPFREHELSANIEMALHKHRIEKKLRESEEQYRHLFEYANDSIFIMDPITRRFLDVNQNAAKRLGYSREELLSLCVDDIDTPTAAARWDSIIQELEENGNIIFAHTQQHKDGTEMPVEISSRLIEYGDRRIIQSFVRDITKRVQAEKALQENASLLQSIFRAAPVGIGLVSNRILLEVNDRICELTGYSHDELIGKNARILYPTDDEYEFVGREKYAQISLKGTGTVETQWQRKDGSVIDILLSSTPLNLDDLSVGITFTALDITERTRTEKALKQRAAQLTLINEVGERIASILDLDLVLERAAHLVQEAFCYHHVGIFIADRERDEVVMMTRAGAFDHLFPPEHRVKLGQGMVGWVAQNNQTLLANEVESEPRYVNHYPELIPTRSELCVPLRVGGNIIGVLDAQSPQQHAFSKSDVMVMETLADQIAVAIHNARLHEAVQQELNERVQREREQRAIVIVATALRKAEGFADMLPIILDQLLSLLDVKGAALAMREPQSGATVIELGRGIWGDATGLRLPEGKGILGYVIKTGKPYLSANVQDDPRFARPDMLHGIKCVTCVPLIAQETLITGALIIGGNTPSGEDEIRVLTAIAEMTANAIQRASLFEQTQRNAAQLNELYQLTQDLAVQQDLPPLLHTIVERATTLLDASSGFIYLQDPNQPELEIVATKNSPLPIGMRLKWGEGMAGQVAQTRQSMLVGDYSNWPQRSPQLEGTPLKSVVEVPMLYRGDLIGVLGVNEAGDVERKFTKADADLLFLFAGHTAGAVHSARLLAEANQRLERLRALHNVDLAITASLDLQSTLDILLEQITSQLAVDAAIILLPNPDLQTLEYAAGSGFSKVALEGILMDMQQSYAELAARAGRMVSISDLSNVDDDHGNFRLFEEEGFVSYCAVPLTVKEEIKGVLEIFHHSPLDPDAEWFDFLDTLATQAAIAIDSITLFDDLQKTNAELALAYNATLEGWSRALELRDLETEGHCQRVTRMTVALARAMGVNDTELVHIRHGALLHDIGKMGVPDNILFKTGPLSEEEWHIMRLHPVYAHELLYPIDFLRPALDIPYCHHEKWDGNGYPRGLKGAQIPLAARIFAVVDVWDALNSNRPYRQAWSGDKALEHIRSQAGAYFDPQVVNVFLDLVDNDQEIFLIDGTKAN